MNMLSAASATAGGYRFSVIRIAFLATLVLLGSALVVQPATAVQNGDHSNIVSVNPAKNTPHVLDGYVTGFAVVGSNTIAVGNFTQVRNPSNDTTILRSNIFSFNTSTGLINESFTPTVNGEITDIQPSGDGQTVWIAGGFSSLNGATIRSVAKINGTTGQRDSTFNPAAINGRVNQVILRNGILYVGGRFTAVGSSSRTLLAGLNPTTGALREDVQAVFADPRKGAMNLYRMDITPDGKRLIGIGNFLTVNGESHKQVVMMDLTTSPVSTADWSTERYSPACSSSFDSYMRDVEFSPDGKYFVIVTTGAGYTGTLCDSASRWETVATGAGIQPSWVDYTGGDTLTKVAITEKAIYVGGHPRWMNNPFARDAEGPGAVSRQGLAALDPRNGIPFSWDPGRTRGYGVYQFLADNKGLWIGSDTDRISGYEYRGRMAYMPLAGGAAFPRDYVGSTAENLYSIGARTSEGGSGTDLVQRRLTDMGVTSSAKFATAQDWANVRSAFMVDGALYTARTDGTFKSQTFNGTTLGAASDVNLNRLTAFSTELSTMTAMFFDPTTARIYFTLNNDSKLYYRYFNSESTIVGAERYTAVANDAAINFSRTRSMFLSGNKLFVGDTSGTLTSWNWDTSAGQVVVGSNRQVSGPAVDGIDWLSRDTFVYAGASGGPAPETPTNPNASFTTSLAGSIARFDGSSSTVKPGTISSYAWTFGDGATATGIRSTHTYAAAGTYTVKLKVTSSSGTTDESQRLVRVGSDTPATHAPVDAYGAAVYSANPDLYWRLNETAGTSAADSGGGDNPGTYYRSAEFGTAGALAGVDDKAITFTNNTSTGYGWLANGQTTTNPGPYSIELWFKTSTTQGGTLASFGNRSTSLSSQHDRKIFMNTAGQLVFGAYPGTEARATTAATYNNNQWHHVVAQQGASGMQLFVDGTPVASNPATTGQNYTGYWRVGAESTWSGANQPWFIGSIDEVAVYSYPLGASAAADHYRLGSSVPAANQKPIPDFATQATGRRVTAEASKSTDPDGEIASYAWDFGDGAKAAGVTASHDYAAVGTYTVTLTVTDDDGATAETSRDVTVAEVANVIPTAAFTTTPGDLDLSVDGSASTDDDGDIASYAWNFGDGGTAAGVKATHTYGAAGTYTVTLTVIDDKGGRDTETKSVTVAAVAEDNPVRFVDSEQVSTSSTATRLVVPAAVEAGDGLLLFATVNSTTATAAAPTGVTGWKLVDSLASGGVHTFLYAKVAAAGDASKTVTVPTSTTVKTGLQVLAYRGIGTEWIADAKQSITATTSAVKTTPDAQATDSGSTVISYWADKGSIDNTISLPAGLTSRGEANGTGGGRVITEAAEAGPVAAGPVRGASATLATASSRTALWTVVLNPSGGGVPPVNTERTADFTTSAAGLKMTVNGSASADAEGAIASYAWDFGDGTQAAGAINTHTYVKAGTYPVTLTVTDGDGATGTLRKDVAVRVSGTTEPAAFVAADQSNTSSSAPGVVVPNTIAEGDGLLLIVTANSTTATASPPTGVVGWTRVKASSVGGVQSVVYAKTAAAGDGGTTVTVPMSSTIKTAVHVLAYRGTGPDWIADSSVNVTSALSVEKTTPVAQASGSSSLVVSYWADKGSVSNAINLPAGLTSRGETVGSGGGRIYSAVAEKGPVSAGDAGGYTATMDAASSRTIMWTITLKGAGQ